MDVVNNQTVRILIWTNCLTTGVMCDEVVNVYCINFVEPSHLLEKFHGLGFSSLKSATNRDDNLLLGWWFIIQRIRDHLAGLHIHNGQFDSDLLLVCKHPSLYSFLYFIPSVIVFDSNNNVIHHSDTFCGKCGSAGDIFKLKSTLFSSVVTFRMFCI